MTNPNKSRAHGITISSAWVLIIVTPLITFGIWVSINYANDQRDEALRGALTRQYNGSVAACIRGNNTREAIRANSRIIREFLAAAIIARTSSAKNAATLEERRTNQHAADQYQALIDRIRPVEIVDCATAYTKP